MTQKDSSSAVMVNCVKVSSVVCSEVRRPRSMRHERTEIRVGKRTNSRWQEKLLVHFEVPVPQTDAGGRGEDPETNGRILVKELGKMTP